MFYLLGTVISSCKNVSHPILVLAPQCTSGCKFVRYPSTAGYFDSLSPVLPISLMNTNKLNDLFQFCICKINGLSTEKKMKEKSELKSEEREPR